MPRFKLLAPVALLAVGAVSMVGMYALADTKAPTSAIPAQTQTVAQTGTQVQVDDHNTTADAEVADDNGTQASSSISQENNDGKGEADTDNIQDGQQQNDQNEAHDVAQPGEVEDGN